MPNATDIITYIGIPLAVLGVMPLLWNMVKSFIIRYRLESSLPKHVRRHYSLIMDPAAGTVSVGVDTPHLHLGNLWRTALEYPADRRILINRKKDLLSESWMGFESIGIHLLYTGTRKRFTVGYDLRAESVNLPCSWPAFVVISLALGVDPYRGGLLDLKRNISTNFREIILKSWDGESIINVRKQENRVLARVKPEFVDCSLLTGLAWAGWMIEVHGKVLHVMLSDREVYIDMDRNFRDATREMQMYLPDRTRQATERALVWVLYSETYRRTLTAVGSVGVFLDLLPVTQKILKTREDIVDELGLLTDLEASLNEIFLSEGSLVDAILTALREEWNTQKEILGDKRKARPYTKHPPGHVDIWDKLQDNDTFKALKDIFRPVPKFRTRTPSPPDLAQLPTPMAILAKVIIAVPSIQKWPREEWSVDIDENGKASFTVPADPMDELLPQGLNVGSSFNADVEDSVYLE